MAPKTNKFINIVSEGGMLPVDILTRIYAQDSSLPGMNARDYHLDAGDRLSDAIARSWGPLRARWETFKQERNKFSLDERGTSATRERWLLPLFAELGFGRLAANKAEEIQGKSYPVSHIFKNSPIHLVGCAINLDEKKAGVAGAARNSPHSLIQEYLNRSSDKLWGFVSNGLILRIVRDNVSLTRQSFVEFDLEGIFESQSFADFALLWLVCHHSRVESNAPSECWLEQWAERARTEGTRALDNLRAGVEKAIVVFGAGFLEEKSNSTLREKLKSGALSKDDYYRELLRLIYRLIFIFVAEDPELLLAPEASHLTKQRFRNFYSSTRLREMSANIRGTHHTDLFKSLKILFSGLGSESGRPELGLPALGSFLWSSSATQHLDSCELSNFSLLEAFRALTTVVDGRVRRQVDYKNLGSEELGSIYESLLELHPEINTDAGLFELSTAAGNERKTSGSYYTPSSLINCLLDSALEPVVEEALKRERSEKAILKLKVCDPACGSGHFLIAAAHRLAKHLASIRTGETEPPPQSTRHALRDVVGHCIYGVDINPMAVELCKVGLWLEALEPGKPLTFLEHRIQCGNSLLGATPALLEKGIPDDAFEPIEGDDKKVCSALKKRNKKERENKNQVTLFANFEARDRLGNIAAFINTLDDIDDSSIEGIHKKQKLYEEQVKGNNYLFSRFWADAWCAAFAWHKRDMNGEVISEEIFRRIETNPHSVSPFIQKEVQRLSSEYKFFHWHLAFPDVFRIPKIEVVCENQKMGWSGGFDAILGNPPWDKLQTEEAAYFSVHAPSIASLKGSSRKQAIEKLIKINDSIGMGWLATLRKDQGLVKFIRNSARFPLTGVGKFNIYALFAELGGGLLSNGGRQGVIVPSGIATDDNTKLFFQDIIETKSLVSLYDFENREALFESVHRSYKFCLLTQGGITYGSSAQFAFFLTQPVQIKDIDRCFELSDEEIVLLNPNTKTCPIFRTERDAAITIEIYHRFPIFYLESNLASNYYSPRVWRLLNTTDDSASFIPLEQAIDRNDVVPVVEAKMVHQYDHRFASYKLGQTAGALLNPSEDQKKSTTYETYAQHYIPDSLFCARLPENLRTRKWFLTVRNITNATNERSVIASFIPRAAGCEVTPYIEIDKSPHEALFLCGTLNSLILDFVARQKIGGMHLSYFILYQLPIPRFDKTPSEISNYITERVFELVYTSQSMEGFAKELGINRSPFPFETNRRQILRAEIDAAFFYLFRISREDADYIIEQFPVLKKNEVRQFGEFRTKRLVLEAYERLSNSLFFSVSKQYCD